MPSVTHRARTCALILVSISPLVALSACVRLPAPILLASPCSTLVPTEWRAGVPAPPLPAGSTAGDWAAFADLAVGALDRGNGRTLDTIAIVEACERRDQASAAELKPKRRFGIF